VYLGPSLIFSIEAPYLLGGAFPLRDAWPVESVEIGEHTCSVDYEVVLAVVNEHAYSLVEQVHHLASVAPGNIKGKGSVDIVIPWDVVDVWGYSEVSFAVVEESSEGLIGLTVLSEIVGTHASPVFIASGVIVGEEVEIVGGLSGNEGTFL
jgi:hypothetical protein